MALSCVHESYRTEFERRLSVVEESLSFLRQLIEKAYADEADEWDRSLLSTVFITGDCAAWLVGRFDDFDGTIDLLFVNGSFDTFRSFMRYCRATENGPFINMHGNSILMTLDKKHAGSISHDTRLCFVCGDDQSLFSKINVTERICGFRSSVVWELFDSDTVSTFINLFDTNIIYTTDYEVTYDRQCLVTNNGCVKHGKIVYPALLKKRQYKETQYMLQKFHDPTFVNVKRLNNYDKLARSRRRLDGAIDRPLSFLRMNNCLIRRRETLLRKVFRQWQHCTLAPPHGYGYRKCLKRFKDQKYPDTTADLCTC